MFKNCVNRCVSDLGYAIRKRFMCVGGEISLICYKFLYKINGISWCASVVCFECLRKVGD